MREEGEGRKERGRRRERKEEREEGERERRRRKEKEEGEGGSKGMRGREEREWMKGGDGGEKRRRRREGGRRNKEREEGDLCQRIVKELDGGGDRGKVTVTLLCLSEFLLQLGHMCKELPLTDNDTLAQMPRHGLLLLRRGGVSLIHICKSLHGTLRSVFEISAEFEHGYGLQHNLNGVF